MDSEFRTYQVQDIYIFSILLLLLFVYYLNQLPDWWISSDDTVILKHAATHSFWEFFFVPSAWRELSANNLTPMVSAQYRADFLLFGLNPSAFYFHHLFMLCLSVGTAYLFFRIWLSAVWAVSGCAIYALSACFVSNMHFLMTRHYVEGLLCTLWALILYHISLKKQKKRYACSGAFLYLLAILNKEIYAPMILLLPFWPDTSDQKSGFLTSLFLRGRFFYILPFFIIALCYPIYRKWMLGDWIGGYGDLYRFAYDFTSVWKNIGNQILPERLWLLFLICPILIFGIIDGEKPLWKRLAFILATLIAVITPLVSILQILTGRHLFLPMFILAAWLSYSLYRFGNKGKYAYSASLFCALLLVYSFFQIGQYKRNELKPAAAVYTVQGRFLWDTATDKDVMLAENMAAWYPDSLLWMNRFIRNRPEHAKVVMDQCFKTYTDPILNDNLNYWKYEKEKQIMVRIPYTQIEEKTKECMGAYKEDTRLTARIFLDRHLVRWELGPYKTGQYFLTESEKGSFFPVPASGSCPAVLETITRGETDLYICFAHPEGWKTCTKLDFVNGELLAENR